MCQVHTGAYVSSLTPGETEYSDCHPRKTTTYILHVVSITAHTHDRRKSIGEKNQGKKKEKGKERNEKKARQNEKGKKEEKGKKKKTRKQEKTGQEEARQGKRIEKRKKKKKRKKNVVLVVVVLTLTRIIKSVVTGQAPVTLELRNP